MWFLTYLVYSRAGQKYFLETLVFTYLDCDNEFSADIVREMTAVSLQI